MGKEFAWIPPLAAYNFLLKNILNRVQYFWFTCTYPMRTWFFVPQSFQYLLTDFFLASNGASAHLPAQRCLALKVACGVHGLADQVHATCTTRVNMTMNFILHWKNRVFNEKSFWKEISRMKECTFSPTFLTSIWFAIEVNDTRGCYLFEVKMWTVWLHTGFNSFIMSDL